MKSKGIKNKSQFRLMLVSDPGRREEFQIGHPFVGVSGALLHSALRKAQIDEPSVYVTNLSREWLKTELKLIKPKVVVCLGNGAVRKVVGKNNRTKKNSKWLQSSLASCVLATVHPNSILGEVDLKKREEKMLRFVNDLRLAGNQLSKAA